MTFSVKRSYRITRVSLDSLVVFSFIMFFCAPLVNIVYNYFLISILGSQITRLLTVFTIYVPLLLACICSPRKYIKVDFVLLWITIALLFLLSWLIHPEYDYWYSRTDYGVWAYVLQPLEALYAYLFVRLINDPDRLKKYIKIAGWIMLIYFFYQLSLYFMRGYWYGVQGSNGQAQMTNSVSFGYSVLFFCLVFLYDALKEKRMTDIITTAVYILLVLLAGSRGPVLFMGLFLLLFGLTADKKTPNQKKMIIKFGMIFILLLVVYFAYDFILLFLINLFSGSESISRILLSIQNGSFMEDNGRYRIWQAAYQMIQGNPWGHGPMGSQPVIGKIIYAGYPHSVVLEILIDYGVVCGSFILCAIFWASYSILFRKKYAEWSGLFLVFFSTACQLLISMCYWSVPAFWVSMGIAINCFQSVRRKRRLNQRM